MKHRRNLKLWFRITLLVTIILCFAIGVFSLAFVLVKTKSNKTIPIYFYNINRNADYTVNLYDNSFIDDNKLEQNKTYISELVKDINVNFAYSYSADKSTNLRYTYNILGELKANYTSSDGTQKEVWTKKITYKEIQEKELLQQSGFFISDKIIIDYPSLKKEVENFKRQFNMNVSVDMDVYMNVEVNGVYNGIEIEESSKILLNIPFGVQAFSIKKDFIETSKEELTDELGLVNQFNISRMYTPISILVISIFSFIVLFRPIFNVQKKNKYNTKLNRILKNYGDVIASVERRVNKKKYEVVKVKSINDLLNIQEELRVPITFYELRPNYVAEFIVIQGNVAYIYVLKND